MADEERIEDRAPGAGVPVDGAPADTDPEEEPQIYTVTKDMNGWQFDRRAFFAAAGATAVTAAGVGSAGCTPAGEEVVVKRTVVKQVTATPSSTPKATDTPAATATPTPTDTATPTPTSTPTDTPTPSDTPTPTKEATPTHTATPAMPKAKFVSDVTIPDGTIMTPGQKFTKTWRYKNNGAVPWGEGVKLVFLEGKKDGFDSRPMQGPESVEVPNVKPGKNVNVSVDLVAPQNPGHYRSYWRLKLGNGDWLENRHYADIHVATKKEIQPGEEGIQFKVKVEGKWVTWTQPCGMPIPPGAQCICDCVAVPSCTCDGHCACDNVCTCDEVCSCDTVCSCVGHTVCTCDSVHYWYPN